MSDWEKIRDGVFESLGSYIESEFVIPELEEGIVISEGGDLVLPEEFDFYGSDLGAHHNWFAEADVVRESIYDEIIKVAPSEWTEFAVRIAIDGEPLPFSFEGREYMRTPYDIQTPRVLLMCGRQVEKSTLLGNSILSRMCIIPHFRALYVSSSHEQTKVFRRDRIGEPIALSEIFQAYVSSKHANNMSIIKFVNHSQLVLRYAYLSADRVRGIPADGIYIDEIQDILTDNIAVIEECAFHGNPQYKMFVYSGTPKSYDNTINRIWEKRSTQNEFALPCSCVSTHSMAPGDAKSRSSKLYWNVPLDERHIGLKSLICARCGGPITSRHPSSQWVSMNPAIREHPLLEPFEGFRIPQIMVPWAEWSDILNKRESYSRAKFFNEVLALPYDSGNRPLKMGDLMRNSICMLPMDDIEALYRATRNIPLFFGIDWGSGENTYTSLTIGGYLGEHRDKFTIFYFKRFTGPEVDPEVQVRVIKELIDKFQPLLIGTDYGGGFDRNSKLTNQYGARRIAKYQYIGGSKTSGASKRAKVQWDTKKGRYLLDRTEVMSDMFAAIKDDKLVFPQWKYWAEPHGTDMLSIFSEYNDMLKTVQYNKPIDGTDDAFHSALYCFFVSMIKYPRIDVLKPSAS